MNFRTVFIAIVFATGLIVAAYLVNSQRPRIVVEQPNADFVRASGKCAECHRNNQYSIVHEYEMSKHAQKGELVYFPNAWTTPEIVCPIFF